MSQKMFRAAAMALAFLAPASASAQSMDGWQRIPDAQLKFETDHAACTTASEPPPTRVGTVGATIDEARARGIALGLGAKPVPLPPSFTQCMRARGWVKP